ncbi:MAG: GTPase ObgE [Candidatus Marinimicrobia bacterium]|nr:GTPase ObgE [Candidatus Neomarinimicrobiota bacterium]MDD9888364.1 GTPase ObgE [Candidatus Neomarinimicrobiota bacterium]
MFVDYTKVELHAGKGGPGCVSFRREKYIPKGGPDGGNGGRGGNIIVQGDSNLHTLQDVRYSRIYTAKNGTPGLSSMKTGKDGEDIIIRVPLGTLIRNVTSGMVAADMVEDGDEVVICKGGIGGKGNVNFKSSTHQTPRYAQPGTEGETGEFEFELKVLADVGLVGLPNAGKSTLLSVLSKARPKIADYPFTTLEPHLGIVKTGEYQSFLMADIPGLIEGASKGKGLGHQFLRHIERNRLLLYLIDGNEEEPLNIFNTLKNELKTYNEALLLKPIVLVRTKGDTLNDVDETKWESIPEYLMEISSVAQTGLTELVREISNRLNEI